MIIDDIEIFKQNIINKRLLGIDYGTMKIGLACTDSNRIMAFPLEIIENNKSSIEKICTLIKNEYGGIIIGMPLDQNGDENRKLCIEIKKFAQYIASKSEVMIFFIDERMTTRLAHTQLLTAGNFGKLSLKNSKGYISNRVTSEKNIKNTKRYNLDEDWYIPNEKYHARKKLSLNTVNFKDDSIAAMEILKTALELINKKC